MKITMKTTTNELQPRKKKNATTPKYEATNIETREITEAEYFNIVTARRFFKGCGFKESHKNGNTMVGYRTIKVISTWPDKTKKIVYEFSFMW